MGCCAVSGQVAGYIPVRATKSRVYSLYFLQWETTTYSAAIAVLHIHRRPLMQDFTQLEEYGWGFFSAEELHTLYQRFVTLDRHVRDGVNGEDVKRAGSAHVVHLMFSGRQKRGFFSLDDDGLLTFENFVSSMLYFHTCKRNALNNKLRFWFNVMQAFGGGDPDDELLEVTEVVSFCQAVEPNVDEEALTPRVRASIAKLAETQQGCWEGCVKYEPFASALKSAMPDLEQVLSLNFTLGGGGPGGPGGPGGAEAIQVTCPPFARPGQQIQVNTGDGAIIMHVILLPLFYPALVKQKS